MWIISVSGWLFKKKSIMVHGNMNVKFYMEYSFISTNIYKLHSTRIKVAKASLLMLNPKS